MEPPSIPTQVRFASSASLLHCSLRRARDRDPWTSIVLLRLPSPLVSTRADYGLCRTEFISPAAIRSAIRREQGSKYGQRKQAEQDSQRRKELRKLEEDELAVSKVFA